ncbi:MAG: IgGFc-binding protein [Myxococcota bacterium]|nr:IgGFc-binding protein [Myxococcota bacterium]
MKKTDGTCTLTSARPRARRWLILSMLLWSMACSDGSDDPFNGLTPIPGVTQDMSGGAEDMATIDFGPDPVTVRTYCSPGERRCLAENSPLSERCNARGSSWDLDPCDAGEMCRNGQCIQFSCVPERSICVGTDTRATCSPNGREVEGAVRCADDERCRAGTCINPCEEAARDGAYIGCEYIAQRTYNIYDIDNPDGAGNTEQSPFAIIAANPSRFQDARVTVTDETGSAVQLWAARTIQPDPTYSFAKPVRVSSAILQGGEPVMELDGFAQSVRIPPDSAAVLLIDEPGVSQTGSYKVQTTTPVVAYQFSPYCCNFTASNDASLLLPTASLGTRYRVFSYPTMIFQESLGFSSLDPYFYVIALEDDTTITVNDTATLDMLVGDYEPFTRRTQEQNSAFEFRLGALERRVFARQGDISGAEITSDKPIAVFVGHPCTFVPQDDWACDHLEEQLLPAETLGKEYLLPTFELRNEEAFMAGANREGIYWRLVADEDTEVTLSPAMSELDLYETSTFQTPSCLEYLQGEEVVLREGQVCELGLKETVSLDATGALLVGGVLSGHQSTGYENYGTQAGDPSMFTAPPVEQYRRDYAFVTPPTFKKTFAAITLPVDATLVYRGEVVPTSQRLARARILVDDEEWESFSVALEPGVHQLESDRSFGLIVYAYDDYVSYAFPGGLDLIPKTKE